MKQENLSIVEQVRQFVKGECEKPESYYGDIFENHLVPMRNIAVELAEKLGADLEIVEVAAWLHDVGAIIYGRENHHVTGAKVAEDKLKEFNYPQEKIERVKHCILSHRGSQEIMPETVEAKVILETDNLSNFDNLPGIFKAAYAFEGLTQSEAKEAACKKLERKWQKLQFDESRNLVKNKYEAAMLLLK